MSAREDPAVARVGTDADTVGHTVRAVENITYARRTSGDLALDLLIPAAREGAVPVALYLHGGGWIGGSRQSDRTNRVLPVVKSGVAVACVSYRFSDTALWPAQLDDAAAAIDFLRANSEEYGLDGDRVSAWGASAGGHIALMLALQEHWPTTGGHNPLRSVVAWFAPAALETMSTDDLAGAPLPAFIDAGAKLPRFERLLVGAEPGSKAGDALRAASPLRNIVSTPVPILLIHGDRDGLIAPSQSVRLHDALRAAGNRSQLLMVAGANHEDTEFDSPAVLGATGAWLRDAG